MFMLVRGYDINDILKAPVVYMLLCLSGQEMVPTEQRHQKWILWEVQLADPPIAYINKADRPE